MPNFAQKFKNMWNPPEDEFEYEETEEVVEQPAQNDTDASYDSYRDVSSTSQPIYEEKPNKVVNFASPGNLQVVLFKPMDFRADTREIADELVRSNTVVLNLEVTPKEVARRVLDFLGGVAYAKNGKVRRVSTNTYIITPHNVNLTGSDLDEEPETEETYF